MDWTSRSESKQSLSRKIGHAKKTNAVLRGVRWKNLCYFNSEGCFPDLESSSLNMFFYKRKCRQE